MDEQRKAGVEYYLVAATIRGKIINAITTLERMIDNLLSKHFTDNEERQMELMNIVFGTKFITYENKRLILQHVIETHYKEHAAENFPDLHAKLDKFGKFRNDLAHYILDSSDIAIDYYKKNGEIVFVKFHKSPTEIIFTLKMADDISMEIYEYVDKIVKLL